MSRSDRPPMSPPPASELSMGEMSSYSLHDKSPGAGSLDTACRSQATGSPQPAGRRATAGEVSATKVFVRVRPFNRKEIVRSTWVATGGGGGTGEQPSPVGPENELRCIARIDESRPSLITTLDPLKGFAPRNTYVFERCFSSLAVKLAASSPTGVGAGGGRILEAANVGDVTEEDMRAAEQDQVLLYNHVGKPVLENALEGYNGCVFAYGQTGSGKTFTMMGPPLFFTTLGPSGGVGASAPWTARKTTRTQAIKQVTPSSGRSGGGGDGAGVEAEAASPLRDRLGAQGIIPRLCRELFDELNARRTQDSASSFRVELEYYEIYNEKVMDLLHDGSAGVGGAGLKVRNAATGPYVEGLQRIHVERVEDVLQLLQRGNSERHTASTKMNDRSSRSHAILSLYLTQMRLTKLGGEESSGLPPTSGASNGSDQTGSSTRKGILGAPGSPLAPLSLKPLATSATRTTGGAAGGDEIVERRKSKVNLVDLAGSERTGASEVTGQHFKEATNINLSLTTLGRVIDALAELSQMHQPSSSSVGGGGDAGRSPGAGGKGAARGSAASTPRLGVGAGTTSPPPATPAGFGIFVPYRDSNLTWLLRDSLGGNSKTTMIATISPHWTNFEEACQTLRYASRAKQIVTRAIVNEDPQQRLIKQLTGEVERLKTLLAAGKGDTAQLDEDEDYIEELRERVRDLESALANCTADLDRAEGEIVVLRSALQATALVSKTEVKAAAKAEEAKVSKLRADVQKLEAENLNMACLEGDLRKEREKVKTMERRMSVAMRQSEKEAKALQTTIRKLEREVKDYEADRDALRTLRADLKAAEERESELAMQLQRMDVEREEILAKQQSTVVHIPGHGKDGSSSGRGIKLSEGSLRKLEEMGLLPFKGHVAGTTGKRRASGSGGNAVEGWELGHLVDSLINYSADRHQEAHEAQQQSIQLVEERDAALAAAAAAAAGPSVLTGSSRAVRRLESSSSTLEGATRRTGGDVTASPVYSPLSGDLSRKQLQQRRRQSDAEQPPLRTEAGQERAELQRQLLERTDAYRRSQLELKKAREELKAEREQQAANERRMINEHMDVVRRLQEEVREKTAAAKEAKRAQRDISTSLSTTHEREMGELTAERDFFRASAGKLTREHKTAQRRAKELEEQLTTMQAIVTTFQSRQLAFVLSGGGSGTGSAVTRFSSQTLRVALESLPTYEAVVRTALESEAAQSMRLLHAQDEFLLSIAQERARFRRDLEAERALTEERLTRERAAVEDALEHERARLAETADELHACTAALNEAKEQVERLDAERAKSTVAYASLEAAHAERLERVEELTSAKADLLQTVEQLKGALAQQEERARMLEATAQAATAAHMTHMEEVQAAHAHAMAAAQKAHDALADNYAQLTARLREVELDLAESRTQHSTESAALRSALNAAESAVVEHAAVVADTRERLQVEQQEHLWAEASVACLSAARAEARERTDVYQQLAQVTAAHHAAQIRTLETSLQTSEDSAARARERMAADHAAALAEREARLDEAHARTAELTKTHAEALAKAAEAYEERRAALAADIASLHTEAARTAEATASTIAGLERTLQDLKQRYEESLRAQAVQGEVVHALRAEAAAATADHAAQMASLRADIEAAERRAATLAEELASVREAKAATEALLAEAGRARERSDEAYRALTESLQRELAAAEAQTRELSATLAARDDALRALQQAGEAEREAAERDRAAAAVDAAVLREHVRALESEAIATAADAEARREKLAAQLASAEADKAKSEEARRQQIRRALEVQRGHDERIEELQRRVDTLEAAVTTSAQAAAALEAQLQLSQREREALETSLATLEAERSQQEQQLTAERERAAALAKDRAALDVALAEERKANKAHAADIASLTARCATLEDGKRAAMALTESLKVDLESARAEHTSKLADLNAKLQAAASGAASLEAELAESRRQLEEVRASAAEERRAAERQRTADTAERTALQERLTAAEALAVCREEQRQDLAGQLRDAERAHAEAAASLAASVKSLEAELARVTAARKSEAAASAESAARAAAANADAQAQLAHTREELMAANEKCIAQEATARAALETAAEAHAAKVAILRQDLRDVEAELTAANMRVGKAEAALTSFQQTHQALQTAMEEHKTTSQGAQAALQARTAFLTDLLATTTTERDGARTTLRELREQLQKAEATHKETVTAHDACVTELRTSLAKAMACGAEEQQAHAVTRAALAAAEGAHAADVAQLAEHAATIAELRVSLEETVRAREAQEAALAELQDQLATERKNFTVATERREQEIARLRENLEFRTSLDLCEADQQSFAAPSNTSFVGAGGGGSFGVDSKGSVLASAGGAGGGAAASGGGGSRIVGALSALFGGRGTRDTAGAASGGGAKSNAGRANRGPLGATPGSANNSFADMTLHELLSSSSLSGPTVGGQRQPRLGAPTLFEHRVAISRGVRSNTKPPTPNESETA